MVYRKFTGNTLLLATHNRGKVHEFAKLFAPFNISLETAGDLGLTAPEETGSTFVENALIKARAAVDATGKVSLADDSGIAVAALDGEPGIYSARWAGENEDFEFAMERVERSLQERGARLANQRHAAFIAVLALVWPDGHSECIEGRVEGTMIWPPRGNNGFGYDPMFVPEGHGQSFGEMTSEEKHGAKPGHPGLSHRSRAFFALTNTCLANGD
jgi:XTP/dITP diphosphohydrolase